MTFLCSGFWSEHPFRHVLKIPDSHTRRRVVQGITADAMLVCAQNLDFIRALGRQQSMIKDTFCPTFFLYIVSKIICIYTNKKLFYFVIAT